MILLAINTASKEEFIALIKDDKIFMKKWIGKFDETSKTPKYLKEILKKSKTNFKNITHILVIKGPGSFSSVRIGVTIANTLGFILKIPIYALTLDEFSSKFSMEKGLLKKYKIVVPVYAKEPNITIKKS